MLLAKQILIVDKVIALPKIFSVNKSSEKSTVKKSVPYIELLKELGVKGDAHCEGGIRQVSLLAWESIEKIKSELPDLTAGAFAENITTVGIELHTLPVGTRLKVKEALLEVSQIGKKCHNGCQIKKKTGKCVMPKEGIFARVLIPGKISKDDLIKIQN